MIDRTIRNFIIKVLIVAAVLVLVGWIVFSFLFPGHYLPVLPWMLALFTLVAITTYAWQVKLSKKSVGLFTRSSMIISMARLVLYSIFAFAYLALNQTNVIVFVVSLVVVYSIYTMLEVSDLARISKSK